MAEVPADPRQPAVPSAHTLAPGLLCDGRGGRGGRTPSFHPVSCGQAGNLMTWWLLEHSKSDSHVGRMKQALPGMPGVLGTSLGTT